jgi:hypothetical protein
MSETLKTTTYAVAALALLALAVLAGRPGQGAAEAFDDQGRPFFPEFTSPEQAKSLEVVQYDRSTGRAEPFKVALVDGRWVIPSHYDYPADAKDRLSRTAAGIIDLKKDTIRSDRPEDHKRLGVLDPLEAKVSQVEGVGARVTLRDASGAALADLILGKPVPGAEGQRFVRVPGHNRVYGANLSGVEVSTRFADWIEPNLLELQPAQVRTVLIKNYKIDPDRKTISPLAMFLLERPEPSAPWTLEGAAIPPGEELDAGAVGSLTQALTSLKIVGVRPKPEGLKADLVAADEGGAMTITPPVLASLMSKGFHLVQGQLLSEEGEVQVETAEGLVYTLRFGGVTFARGEALTAGAPDEAAKPGAKPEGEAAAGADGTPDDAVESRYLFVTAQFVPELIPKPSTPKPEGAGELPDDVFARTPSEHEALAKAAKAEAERAESEYQAKLEAGREHAKEMTDRFAGWYYVVPGDAYRKIVLDLSGLTREKSAAPSPPSGFPGQPPGLPNIPGFPGGPPGQ